MQHITQQLGIFRHNQNPKKIKGSQIQHQSLDSGSKRWTGKFAQLDFYSRLKCHETLFSNLHSERHTEISAFIFFHFGHSLQKVFCLSEIIVGGYFSLQFVFRAHRVYYKIWLSFLNSCSLVLCVNSGDIVVCLIYTQYASVILSLPFVKHLTSSLGQ